MLTTENNALFYTGVTSNLLARIYQHKHKLVEGFSARYNLTKLVWFEVHHEIERAIQREKSIKRWKQQFKREAVARLNPGWTDLYTRLADALEHKQSQQSASHQNRTDIKLSGEICI